MGLMRILGKITGIEDKFKWSRQKKIHVFGPPIYGSHHVYVDSDFTVAVFLPKSDLTLHVFVGDIFNANLWLKYESDGSKVLERNLSKKSHQWKINPTVILYRGNMFSPEQPVYKGKVMEYWDFKQIISDQWIDKKKEEYLKKMHDGTLWEE